jgi:hypothetical protein
MLDKFLQHMDADLSIVLKAYPLPVFVLGDSRVAGHFSKITHNEKSIAGYIHKDQLEAKEQQLLEYLRPYVMDWQKVKQQDAFRQVEKDFIDPDLPDALPQAFYIKDTVDSIIQKVLENGGDVEWVDKDRLKEYGHIALIQHY